MSGVHSFTTDNTLTKTLKSTTNSSPAYNMNQTNHLNISLTSKAVPKDFKKKPTVKRPHKRLAPVSTSSQQTSSSIPLSPNKLIKQENAVNDVSAVTRHTPSSNSIQHQHLQGQTCGNCGATKTPLWRRTPDGLLTCNACGLYYRANNTHRPINLKKPPNLISVSKEEFTTGTCAGDGRCNGTGGSSSCNGCPAFNNRVLLKKEDDELKHTEERDNKLKNVPTASSALGSIISKPLNSGEDDEPLAVACSNCGTTVTPLWRRNELGNTICNACGLYFRLHGSHRPVKMKRATIKRRKRNHQSSTSIGSPPSSTSANTSTTTHNISNESFGSHSPTSPPLSPPLSRLPPGISHQLHHLPPQPQILQQQQQITLPSISVPDRILISPPLLDGPTFFSNSSSSVSLSAGGSNSTSSNNGRNEHVNLPPLKLSTSPSPNLPPTPNLNNSYHLSQQYQTLPHPQKPQLRSQLSIAKEQQQLQGEPNLSRFSTPPAIDFTSMYSRRPTPSLIHPISTTTLNNPTNVDASAESRSSSRNHRVQQPGGGSMSVHSLLNN